MFGNKNNEEAQANAETTSTALSASQTGVPAELASVLSNYKTDAGMENIDQTDLKRPFYKIIQSTSEEVSAGKDGFLPDARVGMITEAAISHELLNELKFVPLHVLKGYSEFRPQNQGGGFVAFHFEEAEQVKQGVDKDYCTKILPNGNELKHTFQLFFLVDPSAKGKPVLAIMGFTGTALSKIKTFLSYTMSLGLPLFAKQYRMTTEPHTNKNWNSTTFLPNFNVAESEFVSAEIAQTAGELQKQLDNLAMAQMLEATKPDEKADQEVSDNVAASMG